MVVNLTLGMIRLTNNIRNLGIPEWFFTPVLIILVIGFPIVLAFSWAFEITPEGIRRKHGYASSEFIAIEARHAALSGDHADAVEILTQAINMGFRDPRLARDPAFAELEDDPGFQGQVERMTDLINAERDKLGMEPLS